MRGEETKAGEGVADLQVVVLKNHDKGAFEIWDFHTLWNSLDELDGVDMRSDILKQPSDKICINRKYKTRKVKQKNKRGDKPGLSRE